MSRRFHVALEVTPPRTARPELLLRRAKALGELPAAIHVISRPDRWPSLDAALHLQREGHRAVWHLASRGRTRDEIRAEIDRALAGGIGDVLCVRGEHSEADKPDTPLVREVVSMLREASSHLRIGVTANPYATSERASTNLRRKLEAGADFVQTQPVFGPSAPQTLATLFDAFQPNTELIPMLMPLLSDDEARRASERLGIPLHASPGWAAIGETLAALVGAERVDGVAVMALQADPDPALMQRLQGEIENRTGLARIAP